MSDIIFFNRKTKQLEKEIVYKEMWLKFLYGDSFFTKLLSALVIKFFTEIPVFARTYGWVQKRKFTKRKILPFIKKFNVDSSEFEAPPESFLCFNDFFIRKLNLIKRPIIQEKNTLVFPADARYLVYPEIDKSTLFSIKGKICSLEELLKDPVLVARYQSGAVCMARLCPVDYHRFHFPIDCVPGTPRSISGNLFSVNPMALRNNIKILCENKRIVTELVTEQAGTILYIEVGATCVGTIHQTFIPQKAYQKGDEKGYFSFGGSLLLLLFEPGKITFDQDLIDHSSQGIEVLGQLGQSLAKL